MAIWHTMNSNEDISHLTWIDQCTYIRQSNADVSHHTSTLVEGPGCEHFSALSSYKCGICEHGMETLHTQFYLMPCQSCHQRNGMKWVQSEAYLSLTGCRTVIYRTYTAISLFTESGIFRNGGCGPRYTRTSLASYSANVGTPGRQIFTS
jgi:hypothetical protein